MRGCFWQYQSHIDATIFSNCLLDTSLPSPPPPFPRQSAETKLHSIMKLSAEAIFTYRVLSNFYLRIRKPSVIKSATCR